MLPEKADIPSELAERENWIVWKEEQREGDDEPTKVPYTAFGSRSKYARSTDSDTWTDYGSAVEYYQEHLDHYDGVGFVFDGQGVLVGVDLDDCRDAESGETDPWAQDVIDRLDCFTEVSPSGEGFHIYAVGIKPGSKAKAPVDAEDTIHDEPEFEMYDESRYFTFTGEHVEGTPESVEQRNDIVAELYDEYLAEDEEDQEPKPDVDPSAVDLPDDELIEKIRASDQGDKFDRLWRGDTSMHSRDHSRADLALCGILAFWTGGDRRRMDSLFRKSGLMREKWDEDRGSQTYGEMTIDEALRGRTEFYEPGGSGSDSPEPPSPEDLNDDADGDSGSNYRTVGAWWNYTREVYKEETNKQGRKVAADTLEKFTDWMYVMESEILWAYDNDKGYFHPRGEFVARRELETELEANFSQREANEILGRLKARNQTERKEINARTLDSPLLCVGNGVINLENGELMDHSPEYKFTRGLQWDYDPENADREAILKFLDSLTKREEDRDTLLDHLAHGLMPGHPYRAFIVMYGPGSNGKTRVGKLFRGFVGEENAASIELQAFTGDDQFATGGLPGAFVNVGDDISVGDVYDTSIIKSLTGDGTLRANEKHRKQYEFENEAAMFFSANEPPRIHERTDAINDRLYPIEMPYRFVDNPDSDSPREKRKIPGIAESLLNDADAMRGLLLLAVEHAGKIIDNHGQYAMPEGPTERRLMYEAASDPIKRFALEHLKAAHESDMVLKIDAFNVYNEMCEREGERAASEDKFKQVIGEMATLDMASTRTRTLVDDGERHPAWKYIEFQESAKQYMNERLANRYFGESEAQPDNEDGIPGARALSRVAREPTGYATVTVDVLTAERPQADNAPTFKATVKDRTTAIDVLAWDNDPDINDGDTLLIENGKLTEYNGSAQLQIEDDVTSIKQIQTGAGYTEMDSPGEGQGQLNQATDGGSEITERSGKVKEYIRTECESGESLSVGRVASQTGVEPDETKAILGKLARQTSIIVEADDGWEVL